MFIDELEVDVSTQGARALANAVRGLDHEYRQFRYRIATASGLGLAEFDALTAVAWAPEPVTAGYLAADIHLSTGAVTGLLDRLSAADLLVRVPNPVDRRSVVVAISDRGRELVERIYRSFVHAYEAPAATHGPTRVGQLIESLGELTEAVSHADDEFHAASNPV